jgi:hypothetical protein
MISLSRSAFRLVVALSALIPQSAFAQPVLTPWDACAPINRQQTRQYLSLIWQAEINGVVSTGHCNTVPNHRRWRLEAERLPRPAVEPSRHAVELGLREA